MTFFRKNNLGKIALKIDKKRSWREALRRKKGHEMAAADDHVIASRRDRSGMLRKRGGVAASALTVVPDNSEVHTPLGSPAPERLCGEERRRTFSRVRWWFGGAALLESFVTMTLRRPLLEAALATPGMSDCPGGARTGKRSLLGSSLATRLRLRRKNAYLSADIPPIAQREEKLC